MSEQDVSVLSRRLSRVSLENVANKQRRPSDITPKSTIDSSNQSSTRASQVHYSQLDSLPEQVRRESRLPSDARRVSQNAYAGAALSRRRTSIWMRRPSIFSGHHSEYDPPGPPRVLKENTYQLEPTNKQRFKASHVKAIVTSILQSFLDGEQYDALKCRDLSKQLSEVIRARVKETGFCRHKLICWVAIGEKCGQEIRCTSRCLWDQTNDGYTTATYENSSLFATATVFAVYYD